MDNAKTIEKINKLADKRKSAKVIKFLESPDKEIVKAALNALCRIKDEDSVNTIAHLIDSPEADLRIAAAEALSGIGTEYAKTYLQHRMTTEKDESVKKAIMEALHTIAVNRD